MERARLDLIVKHAVLTDRIRRDGLSAVDPERMKQTIEMVAKTFDFPAPDVTSIYRADFLPLRAELQLR